MNFSKNRIIIGLVIAVLIIFIFAPQKSKDNNTKISPTSSPMKYEVMNSIQSVGGWDVITENNRTEKYYRSISDKVFKDKCKTRCNIFVFTNTNGSKLLKEWDELVIDFDNPKRNEFLKNKMPILKKVYVYQVQMQGNHIYLPLKDQK